MASPKSAAAGGSRGSTGNGTATAPASANGGAPGGANGNHAAAPAPAAAAVPGADGPQGNVSSLSEMEWKSMEVPLENQTKNTHLNLQKWLADRARSLGIKSKQEEDEEDDDDDEDQTPKSTGSPGGAREHEVEEKNWSQVNLAFQESKLSWKGNFSTYNFSNWIWNYVVRVRLDESKGNVEEFAERDTEEVVQGVEDIHDVLAEFIPADQVKKDKVQRPRKEVRKRNRQSRSTPRKSFRLQISLRE
ncbi:unnamed protein product [Amoebophrya sp. A25]|nr:unnamed protein product [Amoebophrya sp. A25]|eukprot:GSA25T00021180001.1